MCQIQFIMPIGRNINSDDVKVISKCLELGAVRNNDAWGITNGKDVIKMQTAYRDKYENKVLSLKDSEYLIGHNRLATQGSTAQPIKIKDNIIVHNGVFSEYSNGHKKKSDTLLFAEDFIESRKDIASFMENVTGSYSMFIVKKGELFYLKNSSTSFTFFLCKDKKGNHSIIGSTDSSNVNKSVSDKILGFDVPKYNILAKFVPKPNTIYKITKENGIEKVKEYVTKANFGVTYDYSGLLKGDGYSYSFSNTDKEWDPVTWTFKKVKR